MKTFSLIITTSFSLLVFSFAVEFEADILPIFEKNCAKCHMDGGSKGGLSLDLDKVGRDIGSSKAIIPNDVEKSDLIERVSLPDDDGDKMPPEGKGRPLSSGNIAKLKEWIEAGAVVGDEKPEMKEDDKKRAIFPNVRSQSMAAGPTQTVRLSKRLSCEWKKTKLSSE